MRGCKLRRALAVAGLAVLMARALVVATLVPHSKPLITRSDFERLALGMDARQVEAILGPSGDFTSRRSVGLMQDIVPCETSWPPPPRAYQEWTTDEHYVLVGFSPDSGLVSQIEFGDTNLLRQPALDNLLWRAKRQWHRWFP
jgi:hypothetical protein